MRIAKWDPFTEIGALQDELNKLFYEGLANKTQEGKDIPLAFSPKLELSETKEEYKVKVDLPGISKDLIDISVLDKTLTIQGERKEAEENEAVFFKKEIAYGAFQRQVVFSEDIDGDNITANYKDGVLDLKIPKSEKVKARKITIG